MDNRGLEKTLSVCTSVLLYGVKKVLLSKKEQHPTRDKMVACPKVSFSQRFHFSTLAISIDRELI